MDMLVVFVFTFLNLFDAVRKSFETILKLIQT